MSDEKIKRYEENVERFFKILNIEKHHRWNLEFGLMSALGLYFHFLVFSRENKNNLLISTPTKIDQILEIGLDQWRIRYSEMALTLSPNSVLPGLELQKLLPFKLIDTQWESCIKYLKNSFLGQLGEQIWRFFLLLPWWRLVPLLFSSKGS